MSGRARGSRRFSARLAIAVAVLGITVGLGVAPAFADPGNGNGNPNPPGLNDPPGNGNGAANSHATDGTAGTFGSPTSPQPLNQPDNQGHGANTFPGPYTSTRDGSPSLNGNGDGLGVGKPCAGCVGKADNKNPPGQFPNGSDPNAGYECDTNSGIGRTNPAHTGCVSSPPQPVAPPIAVTPVSLSGVSIPSVSIPSVSVPSIARGELPKTGAGVLSLVLVALGAISAGTAMTVLGRRRLKRA